MIKTNTLIKVLAIILFVVMTAISLQPIAMAATGTMLNPSDIETKIDYGDTTRNNELMDVAGQIVGLIRNIAVIAGVILLTVLGIKYMMGSVEEKAEYKKSLMPLVIGIIVVMAATQIAAMVFGFFD